jgi:hypothetical protein
MSATEFHLSHLCGDTATCASGERA